MSKNPKRFLTKLIHNGEGPDPIHGAVMPSICMTSTYAQESPGVFKGYDYTRAGNPTFTQLEKLLAPLENAKHATVFSSGLGCITAFLSRLKAGDTVVAVEGLYGGTFRLFTKVYEKFGIHFEICSVADALEALARKPAMLFFETPTNPLLTIVDIELLCSTAKHYGVLSVVDNTFATPCFQNPIDLGADAVMHSTTKYIGGHSDTVGGVMMTNSDTLKEEIDFARMAVGVNPSPFDAWLVMRGVKTLGVRMQALTQSAQALAEHLDKHPAVKRVYYPGLESHPAHDIARKQMKGFSGIVSAEFNLSYEETTQMVSNYNIFTLAESLGGVESLVCHPASMTHASIPKEKREAIGLSDGLIRFSVGIEDTRDIIDDVEAGLNAQLAVHSHG